MKDRAPSTPDILAAGCVFPSGPDIALADIALTAQLALIRKHPFYIDRCGHHVRVSAFPAPVAGVERWWQLAHAAFKDLTARLQDDLNAVPELSVWLILPHADRPGQPPGLAEQLAAHLRDALPSLDALHCLRGGHASGMVAVADAALWLDSHPRGRAVVLAVECPLASETLFWLEAQELLHGAHRPYEGRARANPYGRIPGEGAAVVAMGTRTARPWARVVGWATGEEAIHRGDHRPCTGLGLTQTARRALDAARPRLAAQAGKRAAGRQGAPPTTPEALIGRLSSDANGEPYRGDELGFTMLRLAPWLREDCQRVTPALASGDLGCASAIAHLALAAHAIGQRPDQASPHLLLTSSDDALRGACVLAPKEAP